MHVFDSRCEATASSMPIEQPPVRYTSVRVLARSFTLSRSSFKARLLSSSRVGVIAANAASVAMSFASVILAFNSFNSRSTLSNVLFGKLLSAGVVSNDGSYCPLLLQ
jgi:hypothetical protein